MENVSSLAIKLLSKGHIISQHQKLQVPPHLLNFNIYQDPYVTHIHIEVWYALMAWPLARVKQCQMLLPTTVYPNLSGLHNTFLFNVDGWELSTIWWHRDPGSLYFVTHHRNMWLPSFLYSLFLKERKEWSLACCLLNASARKWHRKLILTPVGMNHLHSSKLAVQVGECRDGVLGLFLSIISASSPSESFHIIQ